MGERKIRADYAAVFAACRDQARLRPHDGLEPFASGISEPAAGQETQRYQVWAADLTYIRIVNGFVYLAVILDLFSRKVIGWAISRHIDAELALAALCQAIQTREPPAGCVHHSDRGVQYLGKEYVGLLTEHKFAISNSAKGNPYHNAFAESFMKTLKQEEVYLANYETYLDVLENLPSFIEEVYNEKRVHSGIDYLTPSELEEKIKLDPTLAGRFVLQL